LSAVSQKVRTLERTGQSVIQNASKPFEQTFTYKMTLTGSKNHAEQQPGVASALSIYRSVASRLAAILIGN
jgi:hypothetical protein